MTSTSLISSSVIEEREDILSSSPGKTRDVTMMSTNVDSFYTGSAYFFGNSDRPIWVSVTNVPGAPDGNHSYSNVFPGDTSRFLYLRDFGFNIPCNAIIDSVTVEVVRRNNSAVDVVDAHVNLFNPYTLSLSATNMADTSTPWLEGGGYETVSYTDATWGEMLTADMINSDRFGVIIAANNILTAGRSEAYVDAVELKVHYTVTAAPNYPISFDVNKTDACYDEGTIEIVAIGGSGSFEYSINSGASWQSSNIFPNLAQGDYVVLVRNADMTCQTAPVYINLSGDERILQPGDAVVTCAIYPGNRVTMAVEKMQPLYGLYTAGETGYDISNVIAPHSFEWTVDDLGGEVFSVAIDDERHLYTATTVLYDLSPGGSVPVYVSRIDALTGNVMIIDTLPGDAGAGGVEYQEGCDQLFVANLSDGRIYRMNPETGDVLSTFDPLNPDNGAPLIAPLGERVIALAYNYNDNRLYYSVWASDFNMSGLRNTIRSVAIDPVTCDFIPGSDQLEITMKWTSEYGDTGSTDDFSMPVGDIEFNMSGTIMMISETGFDSDGPSSKAHESRVMKFTGTAGSWIHNPVLPPGNTNIQFEFGEVSAGLNARGGIDFANSGFDGSNCTMDNEEYIIGTADALRGANCNTLGCIYGLQYMSADGGKPSNSVLLDIGRNLDSQQKSIFGDVDMVMGCPTPLSCCPELDSPEPDVVICPGDAVTTFSATTQADSLKLVYHTSIPADSAAVYTDGIALDSTNVVGGAATLSLGGLDVSTPITYYVYVIAHPVSPLEYCRPYDSIIVTVRSLPTVGINDPVDRCELASDMSFTGSPIPSGIQIGSFSSDAGAGFTDNGNGTATLDVSVAGVGIYNIDYDFTDEFGCSNSASTSVEVYAQPAVTITTPGNACVDAGVLNFTGTPDPASGISGIFSTTAPGGLTDNGDGTATIDPAGAGVGNFDITYTYTDINGCVGSATTSFTIFDLPTVTINDPVDVCLTASTVSLSGTPVPGGGTTGVFSTTAPAGLTDNSDGTAELDLNLSGPGVFDATYLYTDINGCQSSATTSFEVFDTLEPVVMNIGNVCGDPTFGSNTIDLNTLIFSGPLGGVWADTDGTGSLSGSVFTADPSMEGNSYNFTYTITGPGPVGTSCQTRSFVATVNVGYCYLDLALVKTTAQSLPVLENNIVQYNITICNQGFTTVDSIEVTDYLAPCYGFTPNNGWVSLGSSAVITLTEASGGLPVGGLPPVGSAPDNCITIPLDLEIICGNPADLIAYAEITANRDVLGNTDDADSNPGSNSAAELSVLPGSINDNSFFDANEDDHDPGTMPLADIALINNIVSVGPYSYGQSVDFELEVVNQGNQDLYDIVITDYIPCGFVFNSGANPGWSDLGSTATTTISRLDAGQTAFIYISLEIAEATALCDNTTAWLNEAEVSQINLFGPADVSSRDYDSTIDNIQGNDRGGAAGTASDNSLIGNGQGIVGGTDALTDEDDHDPALFQVYDLALFKFETSSGPYGQDSIVNYQLIVENQGGIPASNIVISDYPETGLQYDGSDASLNANVTETGILQWTISNLAPGESDTINLDFHVASGFQSLNLSNRAEIIADDGDDLDSDPSSSFTTDEDGDLNPFDDDEAIVSINIAQYYDLSIAKTEFSVGPYQQSSTITYTITVSNDGTLDASNIRIQDIPGAGLSYSGDNSNLNANVNAVGGSVFEILSLPFGTSESFEISYDIGSTYQGLTVTNIVMIIQDDGDDVDSDPDQDFNVDEDGDFDPFDDDEAEIILDVEQVYDLSIEKTELSSGPYYPGDVITYTITVNNEGSLNASGIGIEDIPDPALTFVGDNVGGVPSVSSSAPLNYTISNLPLRSSVSFNISFEVDPVFQLDSVTNYVQIILDDGDDIDSDPLTGELVDEDLDGNGDDDDEDRIDLEISQIYDLSIRKTLLTTGTIYPGDNISFRIDIINEGTLNASNVEITENPDVGLIYQGSNVAGDPNISELSSTQFLIASLPAYSSTSFVVDYDIDFAYFNSQINNIVRISADDGDDVDSNPDLDETVDEDGDGNAFDDDEDISNVAVFVGFYLGDYVWHDLNGDGLQSFGEPGIPDIEVRLYNRLGFLVERTRTDGDGYYSFEEVYPGDYYLSFEVGEDYFPTWDEVGGNRSVDSNVTEEFGPGTTDLYNLDADDLSIDAGFVQCAYIGGTVWFDYDRDNVRDVTENGINGMIVELYRLEPYGWTLWSSTVTGHNEDTPSDDGFYKFCAMPGQYYLKFNNPPETLVAVAPDRAPEDFDSDVTGRYGEGTTNDIVVFSGDDRCDVGAGYYLMGTIGDYIWLDSNGNGMRESYESGVSGVLVNAVNSEGVIMASAISDEEGRYMLDYLGRDEYYIQVEEPIGYVFSEANMGVDDTMDSDIDGSNGYGTSRYYAIEPGEHTSGVDVGVQYSILPVEWMSFTGVNKGSFNELDWQVASELNVSHYVVERASQDDFDFEELAVIDFKSSLSDLNHYSYKDFTINKLVDYYKYRIRQVDLDGRYTYSRLITIDNSEKEQIDFEIDVYPNPTIDYVNITMNRLVSETATIQVYSSDGVLISSELCHVIDKSGVQQGELRLDVRGLPEGMYLVKLTDNNEEVIKRLMVIDP